MGLDWSVDLRRARELVGDRVALQGNLDPMALFGSEDAIRAEAKKVLHNFSENKGDSTGHVFNLGHGISQFTPPENVAILVDEVHKYRGKT